jgi:putative hydrolase
MPDRRLVQDMHVHSTFSDGRNSIAENVAEAEGLGLAELTCVDHVRESTDWVEAYVAAVEEARRHTALTLHCAVEAKILDTEGRLDLPADLRGVDAIYAADHQVPTAGGPQDPAAVRLRIADGAVSADAVVEALVAATAAAVRRYDHGVIAHLFSVLPKLGLREDVVPLALIDELAAAAAERGARIEVDERWRCPSARTLRPFLARGVPLLLSTDSHRRETIGRFAYCLDVVRELEATATPVAG